MAQQWMLSGYACSLSPCLAKQRSGSIPTEALSTTCGILVHMPFWPEAVGREFDPTLPCVLWPLPSSRATVRSDAQMVAEHASDRVYSLYDEC